MVSWVAIERILERGIQSDAKLRKQAAGRPFRSGAKRLTDGELLAKLRSLHVEIDRPSLERMCEQALSAEEIVGPIMEQIEFSGVRGGFESDWIWICLEGLWQRWFPDKPSFESVDDKMQSGYELLASQDAPAACRVWLETWNDVLCVLDKAGMQSIEEFDGRFRGSEALFNWIQDLESELWNAGLKDRRFLTARIAVCEEALRRFPSDDDTTIGNRRRALAESYYELGETEKAESLFRGWLDADPCWGWGWVGWSDCYRHTRTELKDSNRCEQILREGFAIAEARNREEIAERLADLCEEQGRDEEAAEARRQARLLSAEITESFRPLRTDGTVLRKKTQINFGGAGLPLSDLSNVRAMLRRNSAPAPIAKPKTGRNEPCPCGSGKKFKRCCGA